MNHLCRFVGIASLSLLAACGPSQVDRPDPLLIADPPPTEDGRAPGAGDSDFDRGVAYIEKEAWTEAVTHFDKALEAQPDNAEAHYYRALANDRSGNREKAEEGYRKALVLDDSLTAARVNLGALYLEDPMQPDKAIEVLEPAVAAEPKAVDVRENLAFAYRAAKKPAEAKKHYLAALELADEPRIHFALADLLWESKDLPTMVTHLRKALPGYESDLQSVAVIAHRFAKGNAWADCVSTFDIAVGLKSDEPGFYLHRGLCKHELDKEVDARADYQKAIDIDAKFQPAYYYLGMSLLAAKKRKQAADALMKAYELKPDNAVGKKAKEQLDGMK